MTDLHPEQHPLLCDDCSDEESHIQDFGPKFHRRFHRSISSGRARTHALGAAHILTKWPDDISSLLKYWWIVLGMFAFFIFLIYNSFLAVAELPIAHNPLNIYDTKLVQENKSHENPSLPNVYMHVFVANYKEFNSKDYIPYVQAIAKQYTDFKYNFLVVLNDSNKDTVNDISDIKKNEMAFNLLWTDNEIISEKKLSENTFVKYISLTEYMDNSPLKKYWRLVPDHFIGFLARCITVWDKGGVAFNPLILTPKSPNSVYLEKLHSVLGNFSTKNNHIFIQKPQIFKKPKKLNNIRDIILDLEDEENMNENIFPDSLSEAESIPNIAINSFKTKRNTKKSYHSHNYQTILKENVTDEVWHKNNTAKETKIKSSRFNNSSKSLNSTGTSSIEAAQKILPKILDFFFHLNAKNITLSAENPKNYTTYYVKSYEKHHLNHSLNNESKPKTDKVIYKSITNSKTKSGNKALNINERTNLITIDLKGNLIATGIACHAFIGTVFSNIYHHTEDETLTDFILNELSLFCKGSLSDCNNVEVILL